MKDYQNLAQKYIINTYPNRQLTLVRGIGANLIDQFGQKYLDLMGNYGVNIFGHNNPKINSALISQIKNLTTLHGSFTSDIRSIASEKLIEKCGNNYSSVYWSNSGAEAIEAALKFAVIASGKKRFIVCRNGYHGKTLGALSATSGEKYKKPFEPLLWEFVQIPFNNPKALESAIDKNTAGFIIEPIQGEGGIFVPDPNYLLKVRKICERKGVLLIIDEIQTGCGRIGQFLASQEVQADIVCLGKGLAGGIPIGATIVNNKISLTLTKGIHSSTFGGNPLALAGVLAVLDLLDGKRLQHVNMMGEYFLTDLKKIKSDFIIDIRGKGLMIGVEVKDKRNEILKLLQKEKILAIPAGENVVRFLPPFIFGKKEIDFTIERFRKVLNDIK